MKNSKYTGLIIAYISFCVVVILVAAAILSGLVGANNTNQMNSILALMSEKLNTSFDMMTDYLKEASDIASASRMDFDVLYEQFSSTSEGKPYKMPYSNIGFVDSEGNIYATEGEKLDIEKYGFGEKALEVDDIYITEPYRSAVTGLNMITLFAPVYGPDISPAKDEALSRRDGPHIVRQKRRLEDDKKIRRGSIFVTYYLETIQGLAYSDVLTDATEIYLVNALSGNYVNCTGTKDSPTGTWGNIRLRKKSIKGISGYDLDEWLENMRNEADDNIINVKEDGEEFTQAFVNIKGMENWNIVIKIPIKELSTAMSNFTMVMTVAAFAILGATAVLAFVLNRVERKRAKKLEEISVMDPLTKVLNRRGLDEGLENMFPKDDEMLEKKGIYIFLDIDNFKAINDNFGHEGGDKVLKESAEILTNYFKDKALVARVGGDEFNLYIYEDMTVAEVDSAMSYVREAFASIKADSHVESGVTFSAGIARYPEDAIGLEELVESADKALYTVKKRGGADHLWYS